MWPLIKPVFKNDIEACKVDGRGTNWIKAVVEHRVGQRNKKRSAIKNTTTHIGNKWISVESFTTINNVPLHFFRYQVDKGTKNIL
jgi:hypothetical protein